MKVAQFFLTHSVLWKVSDTCFMFGNLLVVSVHVHAFLCLVFTVIHHMLLLFLVGFESDCCARKVLLPLVYDLQRVENRLQSQ